MNRRRSNNKKSNKKSNRIKRRRSLNSVHMKKVRSRYLKFMLKAGAIAAVPVVSYYTYRHFNPVVKDETLVYPNRPQDLWYR